MSLSLVKAGCVVCAHDQEPIINGAVAVSSDKIEAVGSYADLSDRYPDAQEIGEDRFLLIPGLVNGHSHGRGLTDFQRGALDNTLESWLLDTRKYKPVSVYDDVALSAVRLLKSGVTTTMHNHILSDPAAYEEEFDSAIQAYSDAGMRVQFNPGVRNDNPFIYGDNAAFLTKLPEQMQTALTKAPPEGALTGDNFIDVVQTLSKRVDGPMCKTGFGPLAPQWATKDLLVAVRRAADELGAPIHVHAVQSIFQKIYGLDFLNKTLIAWMNDIGLLGKGLVIGHCVWPTEADIELLAETETAVTHHPSCNLRVRNGIAPAWHMLEAGVLVGLGLDGKSINDDDDFIQEMKVCYLLHRLPSLELHSPHMTARQVFKMATENSAALLGFGSEIGRLAPGRRADLVLLDFESMCRPYTDPAHGPIDVLLYRGHSRYVDTVMVGGRVVVSEGKVLTVDEDAIGARLAEAASRPLTDQERAMHKGFELLQKHIIDHYRGWPEKVETSPFMLINSRVNGLK
jgi:5-methylthioadenosine/S-adenosylhomocysteine deaminase